MIGLSVIVLSALEPDKLPDPFFMLAGGPGDAPSFNARFFSRVFNDIRRKRDIVLVDLRGTGKSSPLTALSSVSRGPTAFMTTTLEHSAVQRVPARLEKTTDLRLYTTEIAVDNLEEVRQALGYGQINLYGTSCWIARRAGLHAPPSEQHPRGGNEGDRVSIDGDAGDARARRRGRMAIAAGALPQGRCVR